MGYFYKNAARPAKPSVSCMLGDEKKTGRRRNGDKIAYVKMEQSFKKVEQK